MADEEEEDYMSDKYLLEAPSSTERLPIDKRTAYKIKKELQHKLSNVKNKAKPLKEKEKEKREEGMSTALDSTNIGFALLQKMGYKKGTGLGKEGTGRAEPIPISLKSDRGGLGRDVHVKRQQEIREKLFEEREKKRSKLQEIKQEDFRKHMSNKFVDKTIQSDLYKSQKACEQLDTAKELTCKEAWFWPEIKKEEEEEEEEEEATENTNEPELEPYEKLIQLTQYLRTQHYYCIWCGITYNDESDLAQNCPGDTAEDHD
ncbi:G patch domain-containing protein 11-like isoform X2 [Actinia tenebrosa]|uniref:G patch domain-containing protein 11 n=1 Tax=Actinia tenebrosa TaxID=6105 RepID=A0A6P8I0C4_ACTTE|nr:G patch domain-containing protein 11-like isoform X2 [Actinia tenebrosa]